MCGIAVSHDLAGSHRAVPWALNLIRHRGPDGAGIWQDEESNIVLEHCRLAIIDPGNAESDQPFTDPTGRWTIVYNGEIFNFRQLRADLERSGIEFRTNSDTEVVLLGFIHEGERVLQRLRGMFAFVIWDRTANELFAARDQVGVKPFYYFVKDDLIAVCSEVRALLAHPGFHPVLDPVGVVEFLAFGSNLGERTLIDGVKVLPPGHFLRVRHGRIELREYWDAIPSTPVEPAGEIAPGELLERLDDAVAASLVSDVPLGLMLSGGLDSSAVAALAVRHVPASALTAYSVAFGRPDDEVQAASRFAHDLGLVHRVVRVGEDEVRGDFEQWLADLDYPSGNPSWIAASFIARAAQEDGIKVLLSGDGGDELFGGYNRWMKYLRFHENVWTRVPTISRRLAGRVAGRYTRGLAGDIARRAASDGELFVPSRPFHDKELLRSLGPAGLSSFTAEHPETTIRKLRQTLDVRRPDADYLTWMSYVAVKTRLVEDFLSRFDKMGMRHSVEGRVPLLDPHLVRWAFTVPQRLKVPGLNQKAIFRSAVSSILPLYVLNRRKQGFCAPIASWSEQILQARGISADGPLFESGLVRRDAFDVLRSTSRGTFSPWTLGLLAEWTSRNIPEATEAASVSLSVA